MMSNETIKVSVILPVYNVEPYIGKCIKSLQSQTLKELEFIFIDDKSADNSISIVEEAAKKDSRVRILYNDENIGPGPSRNRGIEIAGGEYLNFSDPDDYMDEDFFEVLYNLAKDKDADVVKGHVTAVNSKGEKDNTWSDANKTFEKNAGKSMPLFLCNQREHFSELFKREFIVSDPKLRYSDTRVGEDSVFLCRVNLKNPLISLCNDTEYYHLIRDNSLEGNISYENCFEGLAALRNRITVFKEYDFPEGTDAYIRSTTRYYLDRFITFDGTQKDSIKKTQKRRMYKKQLDSALSEMPNPDNITKGLKEYAALEEMLKKEKPNFARKLARKILSKSIRKGIKKIIPFIR